MKLEEVELKENDKKVEVKVTYDEYKRIRRLFPRKFLKLFLISSIVWILISLVLLIPDESTEVITIPELIEGDITVIFCFLIIAIVISLIFRKIDYKKLFKNIDNIDYTLYFYDDFIIKLGENIKQRIYYSNIKTYKNVNNALYLKLSNNDIIPIPKSYGDDLINYIKYSIYGSSNKNVKYDISGYIRKDNKKYKAIEIILIILFVLSLFSVQIGFYFIMILNQNNPVYDLEFTKYMYGTLFALPIPLSSLILGIIYKNKGIKCLKNIIAGAIMSFIILIISMISLVPYTIDYYKDYSNINKYKDIIGVELPKEGKYSSIEWDSSYLLSHVSNTAQFINKDESTKFYEDIKRSDNWITYDKIGTTLMNFVPSSLICSTNENKCYYSIYNEELNSYNILPTESGNYHIHAMFYDPDTNRLKIEDFIYEYKKD